MIEHMKNSVSHGANGLFPILLNLLLSMSVAPTNRWIWLFSQGGDRGAGNLFTSQFQLCLHNGPVAVGLPWLHGKGILWQFSKSTSKPVYHRVLHFVSCLPLPASICCEPYQNTCSALYKPCSLCWMASSSLLHLTSVHPPGLGPVFFKSSLYPVGVGVPYSCYQDTLVFFLRIYHPTL